MHVIYWLLAALQLEWSTASARGARLSLQLRERGVQGCGNQIHTAIINKPTGPEGDCCVSVLGLRVTGGGWIQPLADNTILHLSELETAGVRLLGHQITSPPEQRRVVLLVITIFTRAYS